MTVTDERRPGGGGIRSEGVQSAGSPASVEAPALPVIAPDATVLEAANAYVKAGLSVVPVRAGSKNPGSVVGHGWPDQSSTDPAQLAVWFPPGTTHGIALHLGPARAVAIDVDHPENLPPRLASELHGAPFQSTDPEAPGRGHYFFLLPEGANAPGNRLGALACPDAPWGDVRSGQAVVIAAPSLHARAVEGARYGVERPGRMPFLPRWILDALRAPEPRRAVDPERSEPPATPDPLATPGGTDTYVNAALDNAVRNVSLAPNGQRNNTLNREAFSLGGLVSTGRLTEREVWEALSPAAATVGLTQRETEKTIRSGLTDGIEKPRHVEPAQRSQAATVAPSESTSLGPDLLPMVSFPEMAAAVEARGPRKWLARGVIPAGDYGVHAAEPKAGKTWNALDLGASVVTGKPWLGAIPVDTTGPVLYFAGEGGEGNLKRRLEAIAEERGVTRSDLADLHLCVQVPHLSEQAHLAAMGQLIERYQPVLVIIDPLYLAAAGANGADLYAMGDVLAGVQRVCQAHRSALLLVHHHNRSREAKGAMRVSGAGPAEWGRFIITATVARRVTGDDGGTTVVTRLDVIGGEVPDGTISVTRYVKATDPADLDSPLVYQVTTETDAGSNDDEDCASRLTPAQRRVLDALPPDETGAATIQQLGDVLAADGRPLKRVTIQNALSRFAELGLADRLTVPGEKAHRWFGTPPMVGVAA